MKGAVELETQRPDKSLEIPCSKKGKFEVLSKTVKVATAVLIITIAYIPPAPAGVLVKIVPEEKKTEMERSINGVRIKFVRIPSGKIGKKAIKTFWMGQFEVTWEQYQACFSGVTWKPFRDGTIPNKNHPVTNVSWFDSHKFIACLNKNDSRYTYRLPTETEWQHAARGDQAGPFPWKTTSNACKKANIYDQTSNEVEKVFTQEGVPWKPFPCHDGYVYTAPVGTFPANAFGLHDIFGNVREWTEGEGKNNLPNLRGGSWTERPGKKFGYYDSSPADPKTTQNFIGFRLVAMPKK